MFSSKAGVLDDLRRPSLSRAPTFPWRSAPRPSLLARPREAVYGSALHRRTARRRANRASARPQVAPSSNSGALRRAGTPEGKRVSGRSAITALSSRSTPRHCVPRRSGQDKRRGHLEKSAVESNPRALYSSAPRRWLTNRGSQPCPACAAQGDCKAKLGWFGAAPAAPNVRPCDRPCDGTEGAVAHDRERVNLLAPRRAQYLQCPPTSVKPTIRYKPAREATALRHGKGVELVFLRQCREMLVSPLDCS